MAYAGVVRLDLFSVWDGVASGNIEAALNGLAASFAVPDFWLWLIELNLPTLPNSPSHILEMDIKSQRPFIAI